MSAVKMMNSAIPRLSVFVAVGKEIKEQSNFRHKKTHLHWLLSLIVYIVLLVEQNPGSKDRISG